MPIENRGDQARLRVPAEGTLPAGHLVEHRAEGKDVRPLIARCALELLRRHVWRRPETASLRCERISWRSLSRTGRSCREPFRQSKVEQLDAALRQHDVSGLQIAMDDALAMGFVERVADLGRVAEHLIDRERVPVVTGSPASLPPDTPSRENRSPRGGRYRGGRKCAGAPARAIACASRSRRRRRSGSALVVGWKNLDRDDAVQTSVARLVDLPHATRTDEGDDFVRAETRAGHEGHGAKGEIISAARGLSQPPHALATS